MLVITIYDQDGTGKSPNFAVHNINDLDPSQSVDITENFGVTQMILEDPDTGDCLVGWHVGKLVPKSQVERTDEPN